MTRAGERVSLAAIACASKTVDPEEPDGVSESAILHNEEAYALYRRHAEHKPQTHRKPPPERRTNTADNNRIRISAERDRGRARQYYLRAGKADLVDRLLSVEQAYAEMEDHWLRTADDLLVWMMLVDRLIATAGQHDSGR